MGDRYFLSSFRQLIHDFVGLEAANETQREEIEMLRSKNKELKERQQMISHVARTISVHRKLGDGEFRENGSMYKCGLLMWGTDHNSRIELDLESSSENKNSCYDLDEFFDATLNIDRINGGTSVYKISEADRIRCSHIIPNFRADDRKRMGLELIDYVNLDVHFTAIPFTADGHLWDGGSARTANVVLEVMFGVPRNATHLWTDLDLQNLAENTNDAVIRELRECIIGEMEEITFSCVEMNYVEGNNNDEDEDMYNAYMYGAEEVGLRFAY